MSTKIAKIELSVEPELNFCNFLGLQNEPSKALWTPIFLLKKQDFTKNTKSHKRWKCQNFEKKLALTCT